MGFMVSKLSSVGKTSGINYYLYITEPEDISSELRRWLDGNLARLGVEIGGATALVRGYNPFVTEEILTFLGKTLRTEKWKEVSDVLARAVAVIASRDVLPSTESMTILPVCASHDPSGVLATHLTEIMAAMRGGQEAMLFANPSNIKIQESDSISCCRTGARVLYAERSGSLRLKFLCYPFVKLKLDAIVAKFLKRYPKAA